jgi:DNA invertase Pin-like site-specific DNA recombinase
LRYVAYLRVSTQRQGASGLGLEGQRAAVAGFLTPNDEVIAEYVEVESGKRNDRPRLQEALEHARKEDAVLLIAKLDRLARNLAFIANLLEAGVEISAVDLPQANRLVIQIMAAVAEDEAKAISDRTKAALRAAKARGTKLGWANPNRRDRVRAQEASARSRQRLADEFADRHGPRLVERRAAGLTYGQIADEFNRQHIAPPRGRQWWPTTVRNVLLRHEARNLNEVAPAGALTEQ